MKYSSMQGMIVCQIDKGQFVMVALGYQLDYIWY